MFEFLYSERMAKVRITVPSRLEETLINTLWELGIIHLIEIETDLPSGSPPEHYTELQRLESEIGELIRLLHPKEIKHERQLPLNELIPNASNEIESLKQVLIISAEEKKLEEEEKSPEYRQSQARIERYKREIGKEEKELDRISSAHYSKLVNLREMLGIEIGRESGYQFIKKTESTSIVQGWIPARRKDELRRKLRKETSGTCTLDTIRTEELPPTYFRGSGIVKSFDYLVNMYSTPRSDEINPAWFLVLSFPIAYGLMVSDVGYGALSLLLSILVTKRTNPKGLYYNLANIWMLSSIFTILFGIFNNQYFGIPLDQYIFPFFHGFDWSHNILTVVMASIIIGIFQISVGLLLGMVNSYNHRDTRSMLFKFFLLLALISGTVLISGLFGIFGGTVVYDSAVILTASVLSMIISRPRSSGRLLDLVTYPLSYVRIMGFGIVSLVVASLIDSAFTPSLSSGVAIFVLYVIVFVLLHLLNMALSTFEAGFQSFRLSFIEFFDEFYTGRGRKYKPFGYERVHTLE